MNKLFKQWLFKKEMEELKYLRRLKTKAIELIGHSEIINPNVCSEGVMELAKDIAALSFGMENK